MIILVFICLFCQLFGISNCQDREEKQRIYFPEDELVGGPCLTYDNEGGICRLLTACSSYFSEIAKLSRSPCQINKNQDGVCCPNSKAPTRNPSETLNSVVNTKNIPITFPEVSNRELNFACEQGLRNQSIKVQFQQQLVSNHIEVDRNSPAYFHARLFETSQDILKQAEDARVILDASKQIAINFQLDSSQKAIGLQKINFKETIIGDKCPKQPNCPNSALRYRTADGSCNNLQNPSWGKKGNPLKRMHQSEYADDLSVIRTSVDGSELPSARIVSENLSPPHSDVYVNFTILIWQWGQFLDHDVVHTPISKGVNGNDISCCLNGKQRSAAELDPECMAISISPHDRFYGRFGHDCMEFVRSMPAVKEECSFGGREQINQITSYIDASNVYGSSVVEAAKLRDPAGGGRLLVQRKQSGRELLPGNDRDRACRSAGSRKCFLAGDSRANEQVNLALMHTIWVRQHNKIVDELAGLNPSWNDEILYQEGRRIVGAQMQHITYNEYLPIVLGRNFMESFGLLPKRSGFSTDYNPEADASITNVFATAGFRYGHTLVTGKFQAFNMFGLMDWDVSLDQISFNMSLMYGEGNVDRIMRSYTIQHSQKFDNTFDPELTQHLFAGKTRGGQKLAGMDLVALNIQRGRDHGIPPYVKWRKTCDLPPIRTWEDLYNEDKNIVNIDPQFIDNLRRIYRSVEDIDLFIAGVSEKPVEGALVGPTFLCILGHQFITLKIGDRFYYENGPGDGSFRVPVNPFTPKQLTEIRKTSLARILCDNSDDISRMQLQPLAFVTAHSVNKRALCISDVLIPKMSLEPWRNTRS